MSTTVTCERCDPPKVVIRDADYEDAMRALDAHRDEHQALFTVYEYDLKSTDSQEAS